MLHKIRNFRDVVYDTQSQAYRTAANVKHLENRLNDLETLGLDMLTLQLRQTKLPQAFALKTDHPVAIESDDHIHPCGTMNDCTRHPRFVRACENLFPNEKSLNVIDLGCAGGGIVFDFLLRGHRAIGLEGSDYSLKAQRAMWRLIPDHLHTCDITKPYLVDGKFHVISAWEVMEHIPENLLPGMLSNIRNHLADDGVFVASIAKFEYGDPETGAVYHVTVKSREWWVEQFAKAGLLEVSPSPFVLADHARGSGNGPADQDWNAAMSPELGFHLCVRKATS